MGIDIMIVDLMASLCWGLCVHEIGGLKPGTFLL